jgi:hypothetical protein
MLPPIAFKSQKLGNFPRSTLNKCLLITLININQINQSKSQSYVTTDDQSISKSSFQGPCQTIPKITATERTTKKTPSSIPLLLYDVITGTDPKENTSTAAPLLRACMSHSIVHWLPSNACQHVPHCLQHARHNIFLLSPMLAT